MDATPNTSQLTALEGIARRLVQQHMIANPAHGGPGHLDVPELRKLILDARALFSTDELEEMELAAEEYNEDGVHNAPRATLRPPPPQRRKSQPRSA